MPPLRGICASFEKLALIHACPGMGITMKKVFGLALLAVVLAPPAWAEDVHVNPYYRHDGTYVQPHMRTAPDHNQYNNFSTQGNVNPYTGQQGTVSPYGQQSVSPPSAPGYPPQRRW